MKRFAILFPICLAFGLLSCNKIDDTPAEEGQDCVVTLCPMGEITTSEGALSTKATSTNDIYAIQVYKGSDKFAFGYFDDISNISLNLKTGSTYSVRICMVKDAKSIISYYSLTNGGIASPEPSPYRLNIGSSFEFVQMNRFFYNSNGYYYYYYGSTSTSLSSYTSNSSELRDIRNGYLNGTNYPSCVDWFYGEISNKTPNGSKESWDIELRRTGFKLKYELSGVTDGQVTVKISNSTRTFVENTTTTEAYSSDTQFIAFYDTYSAWQYADNYTENISVKVTWKRGIGVTQDLGTKTVQVKRNCLNNIKIRLGSDDKGAGMSLSMEDEGSMGTAENNIPVTNL